MFLIILLKCVSYIFHWTMLYVSRIFNANILSCVKNKKYIKFIDAIHIEFVIRNRNLPDTDSILRKHQEGRALSLAAGVLQDVESHTPEIPLRYNPTGASISLAQWLACISGPSRPPASPIVVSLRLPFSISRASICPWFELLIQVLPSRVLRGRVQWGF